MPDFATDRLAPPVISVSELNRITRNLVERHLPLMWVAGEISNLKRYDSGHCYFTLKDAQAQVECVLFRHRLQLLGWAPQDGMQVEVRALPTLYEARGRFQLNVETVRRAGLGALYEAFARLKARLEEEGLFAPAHKRPLPRFARAIGIVTSARAAALRDVLTTLGRRMPQLPVVVYPVPVQGEGAAERIAAAIATAGARRECDVLIVCRGGGSIEDLWAFNEEIVARAIYGCAVPVVTGIGHETDFTIADFVADARAPTPTGAAELASPSREELLTALLQFGERLLRIARRGLEDRMQRLDFLSRRLVHPRERIAGALSDLRYVAPRLVGAWRRALEERGWQVREMALRLAGGGPDMRVMAREGAELARRLREAARRRVGSAGACLAGLEAHLRHLNPRLVLERGYSITQDAGGSIVHDAGRLAPGQDLRITFARGWADAQVKRKGR